MTAQLIYVAVGVALLISVVLPNLVKRLPMSTPIVLVLLGLGLGRLPAGESTPFVLDDNLLLIEHLTEITVLVALMGVGLAIDRPLRINVLASWRAWMPAWRLLLVAMPLCIAGVAGVAWGLLGIPLATAVLVGAALSPTDPVLASDVQVEEPTMGDSEEEIDEEDEVRFAVTSEAGLNDGLAFPFVHLAILLAAAGGTGLGAFASAWDSAGPGWFLWTFVGKIAVAVAVGALLGRLLGYLAFRAPAKSLRVAQHGEPLLALAAILLAYGATESLHGYGFLAVFCCAVALRANERASEYHRHMHAVVERLERLLTLVLLLGLGYVLSHGLLDALDWRGIVVGLLLLLVVRPLCARAVLWRCHATNRPQRWAIAFFGVRGIGSLYYMAYAARHGHFEAMGWAWSTMAFTVVASVILHGITATPVMHWLDQHGEAQSPEADAGPAAAQRDEEEAESQS